MEYLAFVIEGYRGIAGPLEVNLRKHSLTPIIGINECGKTTILHAIFAFDCYNDGMIGGRHLKDVDNLLSSDPPPPRVSARLSIDDDTWHDALKEVAKDTDTDPAIKSEAETVRRRRRLRLPAQEATVTRNLRTRRYVIADFDATEPLQDRVAREVVRQLPYTLYFDDFTDSVDERIEIVHDHASPWLSILETLFAKTHPSFSVFHLPNKETRQRRSMLAKVMRHLNSTLTREWQNFRLDDINALRISIEYEERTPETPPQPPTQGTPQSASSSSPARHFIKLEVVEQDASGDDHFFFIRDRSKGFFWFFNFVMKLQFNPKASDDDGPGAIHLLDEPGSYLHAFAQAKLCQKLSVLSATSRVIYCTHSHHLLNPQASGLPRRMTMGALRWFRSGSIGAI